MLRSTSPTLAGTSAGDLDEHRFKVSINYTKPGGVTAVYEGSWRARDATAAVKQATDFVTKYMRPASVGDASVDII